VLRDGRSRHIRQHFAVRDGSVPTSTETVNANVALKAGSSKHGNARRASVASNCVTAFPVLARADVEAAHWLFKRL
jgi:hypothetical protein